MFARKTYRFGWVVGILALAAMACTCGAIGQVQQGVQTAQALATQGNELVTQAQGFATQGVALATQVEESGLLKTAAAYATDAESGGLLLTAQAIGTEAATNGDLATIEALGTALQSPAGTGTPEAGGTEVGTTNGVPDDIPIFAENAQLQSFGNIITYQAKGDLPTLTDFYQTELPKNGWTQSQDPILSSAASILTYKKDNRTATFNMIDSQGAVTIAIQITQ